mmetsp:Transcript_36414/g.104908  ORF Transcript_36414/g.104908 Transcript_36414/m.104908 type:complete len:238 (-) Transcript_36414:45-758(-)
MSRTWTRRNRACDRSGGLLIRSVRRKAQSRPGQSRKRWSRRKSWASRSKSRSTFRSTSSRSSRSSRSRSRSTSRRGGRSRSRSRRSSRRCAPSCRSTTGRETARTGKSATKAPESGRLWRSSPMPAGCSVLPKARYRTWRPTLMLRSPRTRSRRRSTFGSPCRHCSDTPSPWRPSSALVASRRGGRRPRWRRPCLSRAPVVLRRPGLDKGIAEPRPAVASPRDASLSADAEDFDPVL